MTSHFPAARLLLATLLCSLLPPAAWTAPQERVIVLGFDGADARTVEVLMAKGQLPNLQALRQSGTFAPLLSTNPAESPVSWSSLNCGQNPAKTGIPGFVVREVSASGGVSPGIGFYDSRTQPIGAFAGTPLPAWSASTYALIAGLTALVLFVVLLRVLLRMRTLPSFALSIALAAVAAWAGMRMRSYLPEEVRYVANPIQSVPFWEVAAAAGVPSLVLDAAQAWDRPVVPNARVLAGLGVPDARGEYNGYTLYTSDERWFAYEPGPDAATASAGTKLRVDVRDDVVEARLHGPTNFWHLERVRRERDRLAAKVEDTNTPFKESLALEPRLKALEEELEALDLGYRPMSLPLRVELDRTAGRAKVRIDEQEQDLAVGAWSDWYSLNFELNPLLKIRALTRAKVLRTEPFELYVDTLQIDPARPPFWQPISQPAGFSAELAGRVGPFETVGWACMTLPYKDELVDAVTFLEDIEFTYRWRERLTLDALERDDWRLLMSCFSTPDRVQHMLYSLYDTSHPLHDATRASTRTTFFGEEIELRDAIPAIYRQLDRLVGEVLQKHVRAGDTLILCADHGFQSFRRQVHVNNWLLEKGYLHAKQLKGPTFTPGDYIDWERTRAYSVGLGMIYLNLRGREGKGIVEPADARALLEELKRDLLAMRDPDSGATIVRNAHITADIHEGPHLDAEADLMLGFEAGYRVSWSTASGGLFVARPPEGPVAGAFVVDNDKTWSGDHVSVDPELVKGMFFCNRALEVPPAGADLRHVAPTALSLLGVPVPAEYDLPPLRLR